MELTVLLLGVVIFNGILRYTESEENFRNSILRRCMCTFQKFWNSFASV